MTTNIEDYVNCLFSMSSDELLQHISCLIQHLGTDCFVSIIQKGLQCMQNDNKYLIQSITQELALSNTKSKKNINIFDTFSADSTTSLCSFLSIQDQVHLKQTCHKFNKHIKTVNISQHQWIGISFNTNIHKLIILFDNIQLNDKTFNKVRMNGEPQFDWHDHTNTCLLFKQLGIDATWHRSVEESERRKKKYCFQMGYWLFIATNVCTNGGTFIAPKLEYQIALKFLITNMNDCLTNRVQFYPNIKPYSKIKMNIPRTIMFQVTDAESVSEDRTDFFLEKMQSCFDNIKDLFTNNKEIKRVFIVRKYRIICRYKKQFYNLLLNRCSHTYGEPFGDVANKFVTLKKSKNGYYILYLKFTKKLLDLYEPPKYSDDEEDNAY
eukprot:333906_1